MSYTSLAFKATAIAATGLMLSSCGVLRSIGNRPAETVSVPAPVAGSVDCRDAVDPVTGRIRLNGSTPVISSISDCRIGTVTAEVRTALGVGVPVATTPVATRPVFQQGFDPRFQQGFDPRFAGNAAAFNGPGTFQSPFPGNYQGYNNFYQPGVNGYYNGAFYNNRNIGSGPVTAPPAIANVATPTPVVQPVRPVQTLNTNTSQPFVTISSDIAFAHNSAQLSTRFQSELDRIAQQLRALPGRVFTVEGHTDSVGEEDYNQRLSEERARAVQRYLISRGIESNRIIITGAGELRPVAPNDNSSGRARNRRVEIYVR